MVLIGCEFAQGRLDEALVRETSNFNDHYCTRVLSDTYLRHIAVQTKVIVPDEGDSLMRWFMNHEWIRNEDIKYA